VSDTEVRLSSVHHTIFLTLIPIPILNRYTSLELTMTTEQLKLFYAILETKNSWGKNELKQMLLEVVSGIRTQV